MRDHGGTGMVDTRLAEQLSSPDPEVARFAWDHVVARYGRGVWALVAVCEFAAAWVHAVHGASTIDHLWGAAASCFCIVAAFLSDLPEGTESSP